MFNMKNQIDYKIIIIFVTIPVVIHFLYSCSLNSLFESKWGSGDLLNYCGTVIAIVVSYLGVLKTIQNSHDIHKENILNPVKPYISIEKILPIVSKAISDNGNCNGINQNSYINEITSCCHLKQYCFTILEDRIEYTDKLTEEHNKIIKNGGKQEASLNRGITDVSVPVLIIDLKVINLGNKAAIKTSIGLSKIEDEPKYFEAFSMDVNKPILIRVFSPCSAEQIKGTYYLVFKYSDIYANEYAQKFELIISDNNEFICCYSKDYRKLKNELDFIDI